MLHGQTEMNIMGDDPFSSTELLSCIRRHFPMIPEDDVYNYARQLWLANLGYTFLFNERMDEDNEMEDF